MPSPLGPLRAALFVPSPASVRSVMQGFEQSNPAAATELQQVTMHLVGGIDKAVRSSDNAELVTQLAQVPPKYRGFAYEGAGMGFAMLDGLPFGRSDNVRRFFETDGPHVVVAVLASLAAVGDVKPEVVTDAIQRYGIDPEAADPFVS